MRAPGMTLMRMPVFIWMTLVVQFLVVLAFPAITVALILLMFDRFFGTIFYAPAGGGDPLLWQHLFWIFGHPEVYILILPAMGIVSEVLPTFARKPLFGAPVIIYSGIMIGFFGFGVWSHHMFSVGMGPVADAAFSIATMLIAVPTGVKIFNWIGHPVGRRPSASPPPSTSRSGSSPCSRWAGSPASCTPRPRSTCSRPTPTSWSPTSTTCCSGARSSACSPACTTGGPRCSGACSTSGWARSTSG